MLRTSRWYRSKNQVNDSAQRHQGGVDVYYSVRVYVNTDLFLMCVVTVEFYRLSTTNLFLMDFWSAASSLRRARTILGLLQESSLCFKKIDPPLSEMEVSNLCYSELIGSGFSELFLRHSMTERFWQSPPFLGI